MAGQSTISRGNIINSFLLQVNVTPVAVAANSTVEQAFTVQGVLPGDQISNWTFIGSAYPNTDVSYVNGRVAVANQVLIAYQNGTGGQLTPPAGAYYIEINRPENFPVVSSIS